MRHEPCGARLDDLECHLPLDHTGLYQGLVGMPDGSLGEVDWAEGVEDATLVVGEHDDDPVFAVMTINKADLDMDSSWREN